MPALVESNRRIMPGLRGMPAVITTTSESFVTSRAGVRQSEVEGLRSIASPLPCQATFHVYQHDVGGLGRTGGAVAATLPTPDGDFGSLQISQCALRFKGCLNWPY